MIRPMTFLCMIAAAGSGLYLYQAKHRSQLLDQQIAGILNNADANRDRMRILRAEYQLLQEPGRMGDLAAQHLALVKTDTKQFVNWAALERAVPVAIAPPPAAPDPTSPATDIPVAAAVLPAPLPSAPAGTSGGRAAAIAMAAPAPTTMASNGAAAAAAGSPRPAAAIVAAAARGSSNGSSPTLTRSEPNAMAFAQMRPVAAPPQVAPQPVTMAAPRRYPYAQVAYPYQTTPAAGNEAFGRVARGPYQTGAPVVGSALGMARTIPGASYLPQANTSNWIPNGNGG